MSERTMSLRHYFAARAPAAWVEDYIAERRRWHEQREEPLLTYEVMQLRIEAAQAWADAMLAALEGTPARSGELPRPARVLDVPCARCGAQPGERCSDSEGQYQPHRIHSARALAFAAAYEPRGA